MGIMITCPGYNNGHNNPVYNVHENRGAQYTWQNTVYDSFQDLSLLGGKQKDLLQSPAKRGGNWSGVSMKRRVS